MHLEDLIRAEAGKHEGVPLHVQDGAGHQQVQIGAGEPCPQHLACPREGSLAKPPPQAPPRSAPCPAHLPPTSPPAHQSLCLSSPPQPSWRTSHSRRTSGKGNSLLNQISSHRKQKQREPESWESGAGDRGGRGNALYQPQPGSNSQGTRRSDWTLRSHADEGPAPGSQVDGELVGVEGGVGKEVEGAAQVSGSLPHPAFQAPDSRSHPWSLLS